MPDDKSVALFVTCLIDLVRPEVGFSVVRVLEDAGYKVHVPRTQTCCGQPNYNGGDPEGAMRIARATIETFEGFRYVVVASGSCCGMLKHHYPKLLATDRAYAKRAVDLAGRVYELSQFLVDIADYQPKKLPPTKVTYHDACAGLRELGIKAQPRQLLERAGATIVESAGAEVCCGFGGTFCVKYPDVSNAMVGRKIADIEASGAAQVAAGDLGCLLNIEGKLHREASTMVAKHFVELLTEDEGAKN